MKHSITFLLTAITAFGFAAQAEWTAYNDAAFNSGQEKAANVTTFGTGRGFSGDAGEGNLINYTNGETLSVTARFEEHISTGSVNSAGDSATFIEGSDAAALFEGIVDLSGNISYGDSPGWWVDLIFENLDTNKLYTFVGTANRSGGRGYADRVTNWSLLGSEEFVYNSSQGAQRISEGSVEFSTGNNVDGLVAKWVDISPGTDGVITIRTSHSVGQANGGIAGANAYKGYAGGIFLLEEQASANASGPKPIEFGSVTPARDTIEAHPNSPLIIVARHGDSSVNTDSIQLTFDSTQVSTTVEVRETETIIRYSQTSILSSSSNHSAHLSLQDTNDPPETHTLDWNFQVLDYSTAQSIPEAIAMPIDSNPGLGRGFAFQIASPSETDPIFIASIEEAQIIWELEFQNIIDESLFNEFGYYIEKDTLNYQIDGNAIGSKSQDRPFPGVPGSGTLEEMFTIQSHSLLHLKPGFHRMFITMQEGFQLSVGPEDQETPVLFEFSECTNCGGDDAPWFSDLLVTKEGLYPFRLLFYSAAGAASLEWVVDTPTGNRVLINEDDPESILSFLPEGTSSAPPAINSRREGDTLVLEWAGTAELQNASSLPNTWTTVPNATSPHVLTPDSSQQYFRLSR